MYKILIVKKAQADLDWFKRSDKNSYLKCFDLVRELMENPRQGTGKPERLKYFDEKFEQEEDLLQYLDLLKARRPAQEQ
jgi:Txe/YoeB family toxin of Txe-Axe toxin-antitoxin module